MSPAARRACSSSSLSSCTIAADPEVDPSSSVDLGAQLEDLGLEVLLPGLQLRRRRQQWRALLGRVADPRALRRELGGDEEPEAEQGQPQGELPARDPPEPAHDRHAAARPAGARRRYPAERQQPRIITSDDDRPTGESLAARRRPRRGTGAPARGSWNAGACGRRTAPAPIPRQADRAAQVVVRLATGVAASRSASQAASNPSTSTARCAALNASSSVRPSAYERISWTRASWPYVRIRKSTAETLSA